MFITNHHHLKIKNTPYSPPYSSIVEIKKKYRDEREGTEVHGELVCGLLS